MNYADSREPLFATRRSLLTRLRDLDDRDGWQEFFDTYWRLIYSVARRAGLSESESQDVVQETFLVLAQQMPRFHYDPARGSFKAWLHTVIRGRLSRHWRKARHVVPLPVAAHPGGNPDAAAEGPAISEPESPPEFDSIWQTEWEQNLLDSALRRVQSQVGARQYLLFSLAVIKQVPIATIRERYEASFAQVYLARHRVGKLVKAEVARLRQKAET